MDGFEKSIIDSIDQALPTGVSFSQILENTVDDTEDIQEDLDESEQYLDAFFQAARKQRTGIRGRPKNIDLGYARSTTHKLPPEASKVMGAANVFYVQRRFKDAEPLLLDVIRLSPSSFEPYHTMGLINEEQGDRDKAAAFYMIAGLLNGGDAGLWEKLADWAQSSEGEKKQREAIFCIGRAVLALCSNKDADAKDGIEGRLEDLFFRRARLYLALNQPKEAVNSLGKLLKRRLQDVQIVKRVAKLAIAQGHPLSAADCLERAINAKQNVGLFTWSHVNLLLELLVLSDSDCNERVYRIVIEQCSKLVDQSVLLANPSFTQLSADQQTLLTLQQVPIEVYLKFAIAAINSGNLKSIDIRKCCIDPTDGDLEPIAELISACGDSLIDKHKYSDALDVLLPLLHSDSTWTVDACAMVAQCYEQTKQYQQAISAYEASLAADPALEEARLGLAACYRAIGDEKSVIQVLEGGRLVRNVRKRAKHVPDEFDDDDLYRMDEEEDQADLSDMDDSQFILNTVRRQAAERTGRKPRKVLKGKSKARTNFPKEECYKTRQEFTRIMLQFDMKTQLPLYKDAILAAQTLLREGLLDNPNIHIHPLRWVPSIDWETEDNLLRGLNVHEWADLCCRYASGVCDIAHDNTVNAREHFMGPCHLLQEIIQDTLIGKLPSDADAVRLRVIWAELAWSAGDGPSLLNALRFLLSPEKHFTGNAALWTWLARLLAKGPQGRLYAVSSIPFTRFLKRVIERTPADSPGRDALLAMEGACFGLNGSWEEALRSYLQMSRSTAYMKRLLVGTAYYCRAIQRTCQHRRWFFMKALACLQPAGDRPVEVYNWGRAFMGLGYWTVACRSFVSVLGDPAATAGLKRTAAVALALVVQQTSCEGQAIDHFLRRYMTFK